MRCIMYLAIHMPNLVVYESRVLIFPQITHSIGAQKTIGVRTLCIPWACPKHPQHVYTFAQQ